MYQKMMTKICLLLTAITFSGCVLSMGSSADFSLSSDRRETEVVLLDSSLEIKTQKIINETAELSTSRITPRSFNGHILLVGQTPQADNVHLLTQKISELPGVKKIFNQIEVGPTIGVWSWLSDRLITSRIKSSMLMTKGINPLRIQVFTENNVVYLVGIVHQSEDKIAGEIAEKTKGVDKVVKIFEHTDSQIS